MTQSFDLGLGSEEHASRVVVAALGRRLLYQAIDVGKQLFVAHVVSPRNMLTTSDMPKSGVNVRNTMPSVAFVRVRPSM